MRKENKILFTIMLLLFLFLPISATVQTGTLGTTTPILVSKTGTFASGGGANTFNIFHLNDIQNSTGMYSIVITGLSSSSADYTSDSTPVNLYVGNAIYGNGTFGYNGLGGGVFNCWLIVDSWSAPTSLMGVQQINFTTPDKAYIWNLSHFTTGLWQPHALSLNEGSFGYGLPSGNSPAQSWTYNRLHTFQNQWAINTTSTFTYVTILKTVNNISYPSKAYIYSGSTLAFTDILNVTSINFMSPLTSRYAISLKDSSDIWWNMTGAARVENFSINLNPTNIPLGSSSAGSIWSDTNPTLDSVTAINWQYYLAGISTDLTDFYENGFGVNGMNYVLKSGVWYGWSELTNDFTNNKGAAIPNGLALYPKKAGNLTVYLTVYTNDGSVYSSTANLSVATSGNVKNIILEAADWQTGKLISPVNWSVKNLYNDVWANQTSTSGDGTITIQYSAGTTLYIEAESFGYAKGTLTKQVPQGNDIWILQLYPISSISTSISNTTLLVKVLGDNNDGKFQPLNNVGITLSDNQYQLTSTMGGIAGQAQFTVLNNSIYTISAEKEDYISQVHHKLIFNSVFTDSFYLSPSAGSVVIPTTAPTATATTPLGGAGIGGAAGNATICMVGNQNLTFIGNLQNFIACQGIESKTNQNLALGGLIILFCAAMLGRYKPFGILIGASVGVAIDFALDLLPFYIYVFIFIMFALVVASLVGKKIG